MSKSSSGSQPCYQIPPFDPGSAGAPAVPSASSLTAPAAPIDAISCASPLDADELDGYLDDPAWGLTEAVDGDPCVIASDGDGLRAYDCQGLPRAGIPEGAQALARLPGQFAIDGLRLSDGSYVAVDLLTWNGQGVRSRPYQARIGLLARALQQSGLIPYSSAICPRLMPGSAQKQLALLVARTAQKRQIVDTLRASGAAGLLLRQIDAPYESGSTTALRRMRLAPDTASAGAEAEG